MFRELRRKTQLLSQAETEQILQRNTAGVLSVHGEDGYPYGVPVSYWYDSNCIYFHSALMGHKMDAIQQNSKVSFCVMDEDQIVPEELTTYFRSVIAFGQAGILKAGAERDAVLAAFSRKYGPALSEARIQEEMKKSGRAMHLVKIEIQHMTGKAAIELVSASKETE